MLKKIIKSLIPNILILWYSLKPLSKRKCPICNNYGYFSAFGIPPRVDSQCKKCKSVERHRLLYVSLKRKKIQKHFTKDSKILHFAAENCLKNFFKKKYKNYLTADLFEKSDLRINIEKINLPSNYYDVIIANHVLEHVNDLKSCREIRRILKTNGIFISSVPIIDGWKKTYENKKIIKKKERILHFGQHDHVRYYGSDFPLRIKKSGLKIFDIYSANPDDIIKYGLLRGEKIFYFYK